MDYLVKGFTFTVAVTNVLDTGSSAYFVYIYKHAEQLFPDASQDPTNFLISFSHLNLHQITLSPIRDFTFTENFLKHHFQL